MGSEQGAPVPRTLVGQLTPEFIPSRIADRAGQVMIRQHATDMQILDHEHVAIARERGRERMEESATDSADAPMQTGHAPAGLLAASAARLPPRQPSRGAPLPLGMAPQWPRRLELAAIGTAGEGAQAEIDADPGGGRRRWWRLRLLLGDLAEDGDDPAVGVRPDR
jgi:hypothetical protein